MPPSSSGSARAIDTLAELDVPLAQLVNLKFFCG